MIKVVYIDSHAGYGGGQTIVYSLLQHVKTEFNVKVLAPKGIFLERYEQIGIDVQKLATTDLLTAIREVNAFIKKEKPNIVHVHGIRAAAWVRVALFFTKTSDRPRTVYTLHGFHMARKSGIKSRILLFFERHLNKLIDILVVVSEADKQAVLAHRMIEKNKIKLIENGIDINRFAVDPAVSTALKNKLHLGNSFIIMSISRLHEPKDINTVLRAIKITIQNNLDFKLLIVGDGPDRELLEYDTKRLNIEDYVKFLGNREDIPQLLSIADVLVFSSKWEGLPLVPLEAAAAKVPVIATDIPGVREIIHHNDTGLLVACSDAEKLAEGIKKLYDSELLRVTLAKNAYEHVKNNYSSRTMAEKYANIYRKLV